ncbi:hypothetical protein SAMN04488168_11459 [Bacillus sp. 491mf]|uniref:DUF6973 domain-containing protein n=1 Tax=Bacillus sp. 491mf TaxID=1761755 RepID=UPI0008E76765|nr:hypothetical protein SAMN04488168_11459 [Bacillus sp. 491mf]
MVKKYPWAVPTVNETKNWALTMSRQMYPHDDGLWDHQDAFRHAHWNEHMAHRLGQGIAAEFATAHESTSSGNDKKMDLHNNAVGRAHAGEGHDKLRQLARWGYFRVFGGNGDLVPIWY